MRLASAMPNSVSGCDGIAVGPPVLLDVSAILRASARQSHPVFGRLCRLENA